MSSANHAKRILLGVAGGIGAYKAPALVRKLREMNAEIVPVLTRNAERFVTTTALQAVAGRKARTSLWDEDAEAAMGHIELARWADAVVVAPATANVIARLANGLADDLLTTACLATAAPLFLAPAMNTRMWGHPATQRNVARLVADGATVLGPADGEQACGEFGPGRMLEPAEIAAAVMNAIAAAQCLAGVNVLLTAGPTREFLDPVRFISNRSSGRQGFALAEAARDAGAEVTLVAGPVHLASPPGVSRIDVVSASEMKAAVAERVPQADIFISVAAVADYRPSHMHGQKLKKEEQDGAGMRVALEENEDIIGSVTAAFDNAGHAGAASGSPESNEAGETPRPFVVGFAAETHNALAYARDKRRRKRMDAIVVNDVSDAGIGFDSTDNAVTLIHEGGEVAIGKMPKTAVAARLVREIAALYSLSGRA